ncbi:MAG: SAM-dependent methyltransferase [Microthrixaceae bacterium]
MVEESESSELPAALSEAFGHLSRLRFDEFMELALYAPASGFFATAGQAGRRGGDFITSPEVGPLFGAVVAQRLDRLWDHLEQPERFTVVEAGAGRGALALAVRAAAPRCAHAMQWVLVERSATLRAAQNEHLEICDGDPTGTGPWFSSSTDLPAAPFTGAVIANELLDNIPFRLMVRDSRWTEVCVERTADGLAEVFVSCEKPLADRLSKLAPDARSGSRVPWQGAAATFVTRAQSLVERGMVLVFDYGRSTTELTQLDQPQWLRTYRSHERGGDPYDSPGTRDITADVAIDQLPQADWIGTQAEWLVANGIDQLVESAQVAWSEQAADGGLDAVRARSVPLEADALTDPSGLGGFVALEWKQG